MSTAVKLVCLEVVLCIFLKHVNSVVRAKDGYFPLFYFISGKITALRRIFVGYLFCSVTWILFQSTLAESPVNGTEAIMSFVL